MSIREWFSLNDIRDAVRAEQTAYHRYLELVFARLKQHQVHLIAHVAVTPRACSLRTARTSSNSQCLQGGWR